MEHPQPKQGFGPAINRIADVMAHIDRFSFKGVTRLAQDAGVNKSAVSRLINGKVNPSFLLVSRVGDALSKEMGRPLDPRELVAERGEFPTPYICEALGCKGCLPDRARDEFGSVKDAFKGVEAGQWVTSRHPRGFGKETSC